MTTARFGDQVRAALEALQRRIENPSAPATGPDLETLQRLFNEFSDREQIYKSWLQTGGNAKLETPTIGQPTWTQSPLHTYSFQMQADLSVANNTATYITFDTFYQHGSAFTVDPADASKIIVNSPGQAFQVSGVVNWDNNATGYRYIALEGFKEDGTSLGFVGMHLFQGTATEDNSFPVSYVADLAQLAELKYMKFFLRQTSGGNLTCQYILLSAFLT